MKTSYPSQTFYSWISTIVIFGLFVFPTLGRSDQLPTEVVRRIEKQISERMQQFRIPGLSLAIVKDGKRIYSNGFGLRDIDRKAPMTADTLLGIGSISKPIAATAILQLVEAGKLNVQAPLTRFVPELAGPPFDDITLHNVLTHSTGFPELFGHIGLMVSVTEQDARLTPIQDNWSSLLAFIRSAESYRLSAPGKLYLYNNEFFSLLDPVVKKASGTDYAHFLRESLFNPLKMPRSTYDLTRLRQDGDFATGYAEVNRELRSEPLPHTTISDASGGLFSSANELANLMIALLDGGEFEGRRILLESSIRKMWTPHIKVEIGAGNEAGTDYGYGWRLSKDALGNLLVEHSGDYLVTGGHLALIPAKRLGIVLGMNRTVNSYAKTIVDALIAILEEEEIANHYAALTGRYESHGGTLKVDITTAGASLVMKTHFPSIIGGESTIPLTPQNVSQNRFSFNIGRWDMDLRFISSKDGAAQKVLFDRFLLVKSEE